MRDLARVLVHRRAGSRSETAARRRRWVWFDDAHGGNYVEYQLRSPGQYGYSSTVAQSLSSQVMISVRLASYSHLPIYPYVYLSINLGIQPNIPQSTSYLSIDPYIFIYLFIRPALDELFYPSCSITAPMAE